MDEKHCFECQHNLNMYTVDWGSHIANQLPYGSYQLKTEFTQYVSTQRLTQPPIRVVNGFGSITFGNNNNEGQIFLGNSHTSDTYYK